MQVKSNSYHDANVKTYDSWKISKEAPITEDLKIKRPGRQRRLFILLFFVFILLCILTISYLLFKPHKNTYKLTSYTYAEVKRKDLPHFIQLPGSINPSSLLIMSAPQSGLIESMEAGKGKEVKKGQVLCRILAKELTAQLEERRSELIKKERDNQRMAFQYKANQEKSFRQLDKLKEKLDMVLLDHSHYENLFKSGYLTPEELRLSQEKVKEAKEAILDQEIAMKNAAIQYEYDLKNMEMDILNLKNKIMILQENINGCVIKSPMDGLLLDRHEEPGKYVAQNSKLFTIADLSEPILKVSVSEREIQFIKLNDPVSIEVENRVYEGYVSQVDPKAEKVDNSYDSTIAVEVRFKQTPAALRPGISALAYIQAGIRKNTLCLPRAAYFLTGEERFVYKIFKEKALKTNVHFGLVTNTEVEILQGLDAGDNVVVSGYQDFLEFEKIDLSTAGSKKYD